MKRLIFMVLLGLTLSAAAGALLADSPAAKRERNVSIGAGSATGVYYPVGGAICKLVNADSAMSGLHCNVESTDASVYNLKALRENKFAMCLSQSDTLLQAVKGQDAFAGAGPDPNLRTLFSLYTEIYTVVARDDSNITSFDRLLRKKVCLGPPGSGSRVMTSLLLNVLGWTEKDFAQTLDFKAAEQPRALCDKKLDAFIFTVGHPSAVIKEATSLCDTHLVSVEGPALDEILRRRPYYVKGVIPAGLYNNHEDVPSFGPVATLVVNASLPDYVAYSVTKTVAENLETLKATHPALANMTVLDLIKDDSAPLHPGAFKYYQEAGLIADDSVGR